MDTSKRKLNKLIAASNLLEKGDSAVLEKILEFMDLIEDVSEARTTEIESMDEMVTKFEGIKAECEEYLSTMDSSMSSYKDELVSALKETQSMLESKLSAMEKTYKGQLDTVDKRLTGEINAVKASIPTPQDMTVYEAKLDQIKASIPEMPAIIPVTGEEMVRKVNELPTDSDEFKIDKSHIKGIAELEAEIKSLKSRPVGSNASIAGRDLFQDIDLSSQLDGVTKTFNLPAVWNIISVDLSSHPFGALRKGVDFTYTPTSITFTSEIDAATQLSTGQSCILTVVTS